MWDREEYLNDKLVMLWHNWIMLDDLDKKLFTFISVRKDSRSDLLEFNESMSCFSTSSVFQKVL